LMGDPSACQNLRHSTLMKGDLKLL